MIDEMRHFVLISELGTFTRAAVSAHLTQPALSASIRRLEDHMGARLLHRDRRGASLTAAGEALLPHARAAIGALEAGRRAVSQIEGLEAGEVRLAAGATACTYLLPEILIHFRRAHPQVRFSLRETTSTEAVDALFGGEIDIAVISDGDGEPWFVDELILIGPPDAPTDEPTDAPFVAFRRGTTSRTLMDEAFPDADVVMELGSIATVKGNVRAGMGLALVSRHAVVRDLAQGSLVEIPTERTPVARPLELVHLGVERLPPAAGALRRLLLSRRGRPARRPRRPRALIDD